MTSVREIICEEIAKSGAISFARFMELALYCPDFGYYEHTQSGPGRDGDFYTSVSVGPLFGELLARQFCEWMGECGGGSLQLVEAGAHDGRLASDILTWIHANQAGLARKAEYWIIEPSPNRRRTQAETLYGFSGKVRWFDSWQSIPKKIDGIIFGNELLDAMPVRQFRWDATGNCWHEWGVGLQGNELVWARLPTNMRTGACELPFAGILRAVPDSLSDGFKAECSPSRVQWWTMAAEALQRGKLLAVDYGYTQEELLAGHRREGTLRAYHRHHLSADLLARPGEQDITSHVNFSDIQAAGEAAGLNTDGLVLQAAFLTGILCNMLRASPDVKWSQAQKRQFQTLTHPEHLGRRFRVLIQSR